jgi:hypothetical protein
MKYLLLVLLFACQATKKTSLTKPRNHREEHVFKYTDLYINAELAGKHDSAAYYLNIAMKYDSIYKITRTL